MKAAVYHKYGPPEVLQIEEVEKPVPRENEVLIKVHAASVSAGDCEVRRFDFKPIFWIPLRLYMGIFKPRIKILGQELSGIIEDVGENVANFKKGDQVFAGTEMELGAYGEYICLPANGAIANKPVNLNLEDAAAIPVGSLNALFFLTKANLKTGQKILINGAGGSIGTIAVQLAKHLGAEITATDFGDKLAMLQSIGADKVIDVEREDFTQNEISYDVIFEVSGKVPFSKCKKVLSKAGYFISANPTLGQMITSIIASNRKGQKLITGMAPNDSNLLNQICKLIELGKIKPVIDRSFKIEQIVDAHRYVESGRKIGNVIVIFE